MDYLNQIILTAVGTPKTGSPRESFDSIQIIWTVTSSILEVVLLCLAGYILSLKGIIDSKSKNTLNKINVSFFTPALMFSKVAFSLSSEKLIDLWIVPLSFIVISFTSFIIGWCLSKVFRLNQTERNFCLSFSIFMNSNSLPIALITSLISTIHGRDGLKWSADDTKDKQLGRSLSYLIVFSTLGLILRWSYGVKLLSASVGTEADNSRSSSDEEEHEGLQDGERSSSNDEITPFLREPNPSVKDLSPKTNPQHDDLHSSAADHQPNNSSHHRRKSSQSVQVKIKHRPSNLTLSSSGDRSLEDNRVAVTPSSSTPSLPPILRSNDHLDHHPSNSHSNLNSEGLLRPIFHSFPNVREYWAHSISSKRSSLSIYRTISTTDSYNDDDDNDDNDDDQAEQPLNSNDHQSNQNRCFTTLNPSIFNHRLSSLPLSTFFSKRLLKFFHPHLKKIRKIFRWLILRPILRINQFMSPPLYSAFLSLVVVALPNLQNCLDNLYPLRSALKSAGNVSVPLTLVVLGAYFNTTSEESKSSELTRDRSRFSKKQKTNKRKNSERLTILACILSRMIITPLVLIPLLFLVLKYFHRIKRSDEEEPQVPGVGDKKNLKFHEDPCFILVTVLLIGAPPAITLAQMSNSNRFPKNSKLFKIQLKQNLKFENLVSKTLFISYAFITPPTTIALVVLGLLIEANR